MINEFLLHKEIYGYYVDRLHSYNEDIATYYGFHVQNSKPVAIKAIKDHSLFETIKKQVHLKHDNLASIYEVNEEEGFVIVVREWLEYQSLYELLPMKDFSLVDIISIIKYCLLGISYLHKQGLCFGEMTLEHTFIFDTNNVSLIDYGLSVSEPEYDIACIQKVFYCLITKDLVGTKIDTDKFVEKLLEKVENRQEILKMIYDYFKNMGKCNAREALISLQPIIGFVYQLEETSPSEEVVKKPTTSKRINTKMLRQIEGTTRRKRKSYALERDSNTEKITKEKAFDLEEENDNHDLNRLDDDVSTTNISDIQNEDMDIDESAETVIDKMELDEDLDLQKQYEDFSKEESIELKLSPLQDEPWKESVELKLSPLQDVKQELQEKNDEDGENEFREDSIELKLSPLQDEPQQKSFGMSLSPLQKDEVKDVKNDPEPRSETLEKILPESNDDVIFFEEKALFDEDDSGKRLDNVERQEILRTHTANLLEGVEGTGTYVIPKPLKKQYQKKKMLYFWLSFMAIFSMLFIYINLHTNFDLHVALKNSFRYIFSPGEVNDIPIPVKNIGWFGEQMPKGLSKSKKKGEYVWQKDQSIMVYVPAGNFWRGSQKGKKDEQPEKLTYLSSFYIDKYELNNDRYKKFIIAKKYTYPSHWKNKKLNGDDHPVVEISWKDANEYAKWSGKAIPTEAQWEKSARGAITIPVSRDEEDIIKMEANNLQQRRYTWGDEYMENIAHLAKDKTAYTYPVSSYFNGRSPYGCHNMIGNVWEWCADSYDENFYKESVPRDPLAENDSDLKVCRGGAWLSSENTFTYTRRSLNINEKKIFLGVRFVIPGYENAK